MNSFLPRRLFELNRMKLSGLLKKNSIAIIHSNDEMPRNGDQFYPFRQNSDLFYLTGIEQEKTVLVLFPDHPNIKYREILFILRPNPLLETWNGKKLSQTDASEISGIQNVAWIEDLDPLFNELIFGADTLYLNLYENPRFSTEVESSDLRNARILKQKYPLHHYERLAPLMTRLRLVKEHEEVNIIRHACTITEKAFDRILKFVKPGIYEFEVEAELTHEFRRNGAKYHAFHPIVASGINACSLHYSMNHSICNQGDLLLIDFGAEFSNYASDCSRTIPVSGKFTERQKALYNATLSVYHKAKKLMVKGSSIAILNKQVEKLWEEEHVKLGLYSMEDLKHEDKQDPLLKKYFMHGVSHFMGLDVHDVGGRNQVLEPGMILTCEPGIYIPDERTGIRIETNILITEDQPIDLMQQMPVETEEIEEAMRR